MIRDEIWISNRQRVENNLSAQNVGRGKHDDNEEQLHYL